MRCAGNPGHPVRRRLRPAADVRGPSAHADQAGLQAASRGKLHRWLHQSRAPLFRGRLQILRRACPGQPALRRLRQSRRPRRIYLHPRAAQPARRLLPRARPRLRPGRAQPLAIGAQFKRIMGDPARRLVPRQPGPLGAARRRLRGLLVPPPARPRALGAPPTATGPRPAATRASAPCCAAPPRPRGAPPQPSAQPAAGGRPEAAAGPSRRRRRRQQPQPEPCSLLETLLGGC